jgi:hypothetical protein
MNPRNILYPILSLVVFAAITLSSCRKSCQDPTNPKCENYDPCYKVKKTSAYFVIEERLMNSDKWIECDSVNGVGNISSVRFTAMQDADSFIWTLGGETIHTKSFTRNTFPQQRYIPVTLVVINKNPNKQCHPDDDGRDTFTRTMYTWGREWEWDGATESYVKTNQKPIQGIYKGYYQSNPKKEVTIIARDTSYPCSILQDKSRTGLIGLNIPDGYFRPTFDDSFCGFFGPPGWITHPIAATLYFRSIPVSLKDNFNRDSLILASGFMQLSRDLRTVEIDIEYYNFREPLNERVVIKDKFKGIKIQ